MARTEERPARPSRPRLTLRRPSPPRSPGDAERGAAALRRVLAVYFIVLIALTLFIHSMLLLEPWSSLWRR